MGNFIYTTNIEDQIFIDQKGYKYNGIYSSVTFIICNDTGFKYLMKQMPNQDNSANVMTIFTIPKLAFNGIDYPSDYATSSKTWETKGFQVLDFDQDTAPFVFNSIPKVDNLTSLQNYVPRNKKLLTYPYIYLAFNPKVGNSKIYKFENFFEGQPAFEFISEINPNPDILCIPMGYRHASNTYGADLEDIASISGYPSISTRNDNFNIWMAQNSNLLSLNLAKENLNYQQSTVNNVLNTAKSLDTSNLLTTVANSAEGGLNQAFLQQNHELNIKSQLAQIEKQQLLPDSATLSQNNSTILGYDLLNSQIFTTYCIKEEFARKLDNYFDMYGYLTNDVKVPNLNNRPNWNYVKTIGANITANIPQLDLQTIKNMFDNGITLWHDPQTFMDYSQYNR